jgi:predicted dehydrogenase
MAEPITTAILGLGRAGWSIHAKALTGRDDYKVVAVADPIDERLKEAKDRFGCDTFHTLEELLEGSDAELVIVATQSGDHAEHSVACLRAGRDVLVEKPMATSLADADRLLKEAKKSGKMLTVHQSARLAADFVHIRNVIASGKLGEVFYVKKGQYKFARRNDWQMLRKYGGGELNNNGVHGLDQCYLLLESKVKDVWGDLQRTICPGDAEDHVKVLIRGENDRVIDYEMFSACAVPPPRWIVCGTRGTLSCDGGTSKIKYFEEGALPELEVVDAKAVAERKYGIGETIPWKEEEIPAKDDPGAGFHDRLRASLREGKELWVKPEECREVLSIMERARLGTGFPV